MRTLKQIFQNDNEEELIFKASVDFKVFAERFLGLTIKDFHLEWIKAVLNNDRVVIICPRQFGKTTIMGVALPIWVCTFNHDQNILIISKKHDEAKKVLRKIRHMVIDNSFLKRLVPVNTDSVWTQTELELNTNNIIHTKPYNDSIKGGTHTLVIPDELDFYDDTELFFTHVIPTVSHTKGKIICITTPRGAESLSQQLRRVGWKYIHYSAIKPDGTPLWPEVFSIKHLNNLRAELGEVAYSSEYLCDPLAMKDKIYPMSEVPKMLDTNLALEPSVDDLGQAISKINIKKDDTKSEFEDVLMRNIYL